MKSILRISTIFYFLDMACDIFFDGIFKNFAIFDLNLYKFKVGDKFDISIHGIGSLIIKKCEMIKKENNVLTIRCNHEGKCFNLIIKRGCPVEVEDVC